MKMKTNRRPCRPEDVLEAGTLPLDATYEIIVIAPPNAPEGGSAWDEKNYTNYPSLRLSVRIPARQQYLLVHITSEKMLMGEKLRQTWGSSSNDEAYRFKYAHFCAATLKDCLMLALAEVARVYKTLDEVRLEREAMLARRQAAIDASYASILVDADE